MYCRFPGLNPPCCARQALALIARKRSCGRSPTWRKSRLASSFAHRPPSTAPWRRNGRWGQGLPTVFGELYLRQMAYQIHQIHISFFAPRKKVLCAPMHFSFAPTYVMLFLLTNEGHTQCSCEEFRFLIIVKALCLVKKLLRYLH